ncbi:MAG: hypothetical protein EPO35_12670 [Acidobacteria bacterium]|nr:MAG: hypothetical protein EPO35_12670 [Acidobacteriota bacterium]
MKRIAFATLVALSFSAGLVAQGGQTAQATPPPPPDPRVGLKAGFRDAGTAARNMVLVSSLPKPEGFDDPDGSKGLTFANSDIAFGHDTLYLGNFYGINFYDVEDPSKVRLKTSIPCQGGQGDVSVYGKLLFMSVEATSGRIDCGPAPVVAPAPPAPNAAGAAAPAGRGGRGAQQAPDPNRFRGVRIFDISDPLKPKQIAAVQTCRGSHTHSLVTSAKDKDNIYIYGSGTSGVRPGEELAGCVADENDPNTSLFSIDVIKVPLASPEKAAVVNRPRIFADEATGALGGLWQGGNHGAGTQTSRMTNQCHDITVYPALGLAAGACSGNGILLDISDPAHPVRLDDVADPNFAYWHSASFNNDGTKVLFTDEWGGGTSPRCRATDLPTWGADAIFTLTNKRLKFAGYYKLPAAQTETENCVAHNGSLVPVPGRDIKAQAWYQGGVSVFDFTDGARPVEIAFFDRGPLSDTKLIVGGYWSTYWYNGYIYASEIARGLDVLKLTPSDLLTQNEIDAANLVKFTELNVQSQPKIVWPAKFVVAKAYLDQLARSKAIPADRIDAAMKQISDVDAMPAGAARTAAAARLAPLAAAFTKDAATAKGQDAARLKALAAVILAAK